MLRIALILLVGCVALPATSWHLVCNGQASGAGSCPPSSTVPAERGFFYKVPWDATNGEFVYYGATTANGSIYSSALWGVKYNGTTYTFTKHVDNGQSGGNHCGQSGSPGDAFNPALGHPNGYLAYDATNQRIVLTEQLCSNQFAGFTFVYNALTQAMGSIIPHSPTAAYSTGDGTWNANWINFQNMEWSAVAGKMIYGTSSLSNYLMIESADLISYTNISSTIAGSDGPTCVSGTSTQCPPAILTVPAMLNDGTYLYIVAGCNGTSPGNKTPNVCFSNQNDVWRYEPVSKVFDKMAAAGGTKPPSTYGSYPFAAYDSTRSRILWYADDGALWAGAISGTGITWTTLTVGGTAPTFAGAAFDVANGNNAGYDPVNDTFVIFSGVSQTNSPTVYFVDFSPPPAIITTSLSNGAVGAAYSQTITTTGSPTCSVTAGSAPAGLSLSSGCVLSGTPTTAGIYSFTVTATNGVSPDATQSYAINITGAGPSISMSGGISRKVFQP